MEPKKFTANDVFVSTPYGRIIATIERMVCASVLTILALYLIFFVAYPSGPNHPPFLLLFILLAVILNGVIKELWKKSFIVWRFYKDPDLIMIAAYKAQQIERIKKEIESNESVIEEVRVKNLELERQIIDLS